MSFVRTDGGWGAQAVPYAVDNGSFATRELDIVEKAIKKWNEQAPTRLVPRTNQTDHLFFRRHHKRCFSKVGRQGGRQEVMCAVEAKGVGSVMHEIGHAMGLFHEHQRPDRDTFVRVTSSDSNRRKKSGHQVAAIGKYDLGSLMHYSEGSDLSVKGSTTKNVGQRNGLSKRDIAGLLWLRRDWQRESGVLAQISVSHDGKALWGVNPECEIFTRRLADSGWTRVSGSLRNVSVGPSDVIWGVNPKGEILRRGASSGPWSRVSGVLRWISVGKDLSVWGTNDKREIFRRSGTSWKRVSGSLAYVSVGTKRHVWGVNERGEIFRRSGQAWRRKSGSLSWISVGSDGTVWGVNNRNEIFMRDGADQWTRVAGSLKRVDVGDFNTVFGVNARNEIFSYRE